ncbi:MAG: hypothetical protein R3E79_61630 [Caldilineaceae bacterium]
MYMEALPDLAQQPYLEPLLSHLEWAVANPRVLSIGAGAVYEAYRYLETYGFSRLQIDCIDPVRNAAAQTPRPSDDFGAQVRWEALDLARFAPRRQYHLIWSSDLFDLLDDHLGKRVLAHLLQAAAPDGEVVIGSHAGANRLRNLAKACGVPAAAMTLRRGLDGAKLFLHIKQADALVNRLATSRPPALIQLN